jgi:nitrate/nitrite transporter NarK
VLIFMVKVVSEQKLLVLAMIGCVVLWLLKLYKNAPVHVQAVFVVFVWLMILFVLLLSVYNRNVFNVICVISECMVRVCQGQIMHISWIRASEIVCFCGGDSTGNNLGTDWLKYNTCNIL